MNYVFFGTPEFAAIVLGKLVEAKIPPSLVITNPDRPAGRKKIITPPPTKLLAKKYNIPLAQPEVLSNFKFEIRNSKFDFFVVAAYAKILSKEILQIPRLHVIGVHPSLLPKYRGPTPIQSAILNNEKETGVTLFLLDEKIDHGPVLVSRELEIQNSNFEILNKRLAELAGDLLVKTIPEFTAGRLIPQKQEETTATYTKKFTSQDGFVEPEILEAALADLNREEAKLIEIKIRALNPEPGVWTYAKALTNPKAEQARYGASRHIRIDGEKRVKLLEAEIRENKLILKKIQIEGRKPTNQVLGDRF